MTSTFDPLELVVAAAISREGYPIKYESAGDYRRRLARAAIKAVHEWDVEISELIQREEWAND